MARADFDAALRMSEADAFVDALSPRMGRSLVETAASSQKRMESLLGKRSQAKGLISNKIRKILDAPPS